MDRQIFGVVFIIWCINVAAALSPLNNQLKLNEVYLKPSFLANENEEFIEILLPSFMYEFGIVLIDRSFILDYIDFRKTDIKTGSDDVNNEKRLIVISNNATTANIHFFFKEMNLRATSVQALLLIKKPINIADINKLELRQIVSGSHTFHQLSRSAPLTNGNKEVIRRLLVDIIVYRGTPGDDDVNAWVQTIEARWTGKANLLPTGIHDLLDKFSLARCDRAHFAGNSFRYDTPTPGTKNLCAPIVDPTIELQEPAGLSLLHSSQLNAQRSSSAVDIDTSPMEAPPEQRVAIYMEQLKTEGMIGKKMEEFFSTGASRNFYSFLPNPVDFKQSAIRCELCFRTLQNPTSSTSLERTSSTTPNIMKADGQKCRTNSRDTWTKIKQHEDFPFHKEALSELMKSGKNDQSDVYEEIESSENLVVTANKIALVYIELKVGASMRAHETLSQGLLYLGFPLGQTLNSAKAAHDIISFLGKKIHSNLIQRLIKTDVEFSIMLDASTDVGLVHTLLIYIRYTEDGMPVVKVLGLTEAHDSSALGMWTVIENLIKSEGTEFEAYFKRRCVALGTDGASSMLGNYNSLKTRFSAYVLTGERAGKQFQTYHCANHRLALAYNDVMYSRSAELLFCKKMTDNCNDLARFYSSKSYKRRDELLTESRELDESIRSFARIQKVRWVPATQTSYESIVQNYRTFMPHLGKVSDANAPHPYPPEARNTAAHLKETFSDKNYIATLHYHLDIIQELSKWAKTLEKKEATVIDIEQWFREIINTLENMKQTPGPKLEQFLQSCKCGITPCTTLTIYEQTTEVSWKGQTLSEKTNSQVPKLSLTKDIVVSSLVESLKNRFPPEAVSAFSVLNPTFLHMTTDNQWHNLGIYLNRFYGFPTTISIHLITLKNSIITSTFHEQYSEDPPEVYWPNAFRNQDFKWTDDLKRVIRIALVQPSSTASVESGFSLVTAIKTQYRSRLGTNIVQDSLRVKFNGPSVEYLPKFRLARDWINEGHHRADTGKRHKSFKVLRRSDFVATMRF